MRDPDRFAWPDGARAAVSLTFDDGRVSQLIHGLPILDRHDVQATFYVTPDCVDPHLDQWRRVAADGHEIGNHSLSHVCSGNFGWGCMTLEDMTLDEMEADILAGRDGLAERFGRTPRTFAYPCGQDFVGRGESCRSYTPLVAKYHIAGRRFREETYNDPGFSDLTRLAGTEGDGCSFQQLQRMLDNARDQHAWIVLAIHDVGTDQPAQVMPADVLDALCAHCKDADNGIWIDTVEHIADYIVQKRSDG